MQRTGAYTAKTYQLCTVIIIVLTLLYNFIVPNMLNNISSTNTTGNDNAYFNEKLK